MIDFRLAKNKRFNSVTKSNTTVALPGIQKTIAYQDTQHKKNKSSYLETISHLSSNVEYDKKDTLYVNKEQHTLKTILKKMNRDTMDLIEHLRPKPNHKPISQEILTQTAEKQIENSKKMISILKHQIDNLKEKYNRMVDQQEEQVLLTKITSTKEEIEKLKHVNIEQKVSVQKDSKQIVREFSEQHSQKLLMLETDQQMTACKLQKLKAESLALKEEQTKLASKTKEADQMMQLIEDEYLQAKSKKLAQADSKKRQTQYNQKKLHLQSIKKKIDFHNSFGQVRYYKALKELQAENEVCSMIDGKTFQIEGKNKYIRDQVAKLEVQFNQLKRKKREKGKAVKDYLESERMSRVVQNSRVLSDLNASQIQIKPDNSKEDSEYSRVPDKQRKAEQIRIQAAGLLQEDPNQSNKPRETASELKSLSEHENNAKEQIKGYKC